MLEHDIETTEERLETSEVARKEADNVREDAERQNKRLTCDVDRLEGIKIGRVTCLWNNYCSGRNNCTIIMGQATSTDFCIGVSALKHVM